MSNETNMAQVIDDNIRTTQSGTTDLGDAPSAQAQERRTRKPIRFGLGEGGNGVDDTDVGNTSNADTGNSSGMPSLSGASDVVSDFDYYKNKLEQDGTGTLVRNKYESQVKQTATESARYVAENISKGNQSYEQNAYVAAQTADKFGWSGGYALDAARQVEYLRASIQADIFSQQELQKLGYKSNLEAAYASAELELNEQAQNNYYQAQQMAINQATLTGQYIDPAIADMCIQASAASAIMNREGIDKTSEEYKKAEKVYNYMAENLKARGNTKNGTVEITPVAIQTLADIQMEMEKLNFEQAKIQVLNSIVESGGIALPVIGDDGQIVSWTSSPSAAINENLAKFYQSQPDAFTSKVNELMTNMSTGYKSWLQMKDANGNLVNNGKSFEEFLKTAYKNPSALTDLLNLVGPSQNSYTQGDLTVTKDNEGNWTVSMGETSGSTGSAGNGNINVTNDNEGNINITNDLNTNDEVPAGVSVKKETNGKWTVTLTDKTKTGDNAKEAKGIVSETLKNESLSAADRCNIVKALLDEGVITLSDIDYKTFLKLDMGAHGLSEESSRITTGDTITIDSGKYNTVDGHCTMTLYPIGDYHLSEETISGVLFARGIPKDSEITLESFKVNGTPIIYGDYLYVWSDAKDKFLRAWNTEDVKLLKAGLKNSIYDMSYNYS